MNLGMPELLIVFVVVLILFGGKRLPGLAKAIGDSVREFKKGLSPEDQDRADTENRVERQAQLPRTPISPAIESAQPDAAVDPQTDSRTDAPEKDKTRRS